MRRSAANLSANEERGMGARHRSLPVWFVRGLI